MGTLLAFGSVRVVADELVSLAAAVRVVVAVQPSLSFADDGSGLVRIDGPEAVRFSRAIQEIMWFAERLRRRLDDDWTDGAYEIWDSRPIDRLDCEYAHVDALRWAIFLGRYFRTLGPETPWTRGEHDADGLGPSELLEMADTAIEQLGTTDPRDPYCAQLYIKREIERKSWRSLAQWYTNRQPSAPNWPPLEEGGLRSQLTRWCKDKGKPLTPGTAGRPSARR